MWRRILRDYINHSVLQHTSKPPLRWIANWAGSIASKHMLELSYMEDEGIKGFRYKYYGWLWDTFWPLYQKYGSFYVWNMDTDAYWENTGTVDPDYEMSDYDSLEYEQYHWDFIDAETGDAFKVIRME